jgi:electron-transferring-flavoprotein dehydrogenase
VFPGGLLAGCEAGFLNGAKIKGTHTAIKTGMLAAESVFAALAEGDAGGRALDDYERSVDASWVGDELRRARNFSAGFKRFGRLGGSSLAFVEHNLLRGRSPLSLRDGTPDHARLEPAGNSTPIEYPPPDGIISFDRLSSVYLADTEHEEDQPVHLRLIDESLPTTHHLPVFDEPAQRYCPAAVYEIVNDAAGAPRFQINAANCVHCKACDIKDPSQNIVWVPPEGGSGPNYSGM